MRFPLASGGSIVTMRASARCVTGKTIDTWRRGPSPRALQEASAGGDRPESKLDRYSQGYDLRSSPRSVWGGIDGQAARVGVHLPAAEGVPEKGACER